MTIVSAFQEDFQYYRNNRANSWTSDGHLNIMPTLTAADYGEDFLYSGRLDLTSEDPDHPCNIWWNQDNLCYDKAGQDIVKPIQLARLETKVGCFVTVEEIQIFIVEQIQFPVWSGGDSCQIAADGLDPACPVVDAGGEQVWRLPCQWRD